MKSNRTMASSEALYLACHDGNKEEVIRLLRKEIDLATAKDAVSGETALHFACIHGWLDVVRYIITKKAFNPQVMNYSRKTPLHYACEYDHLEIVKYLVDELKCNVDIPDDKQNSPLSYACLKCHKEVVEYLVIGKDKHLSPGDEKKTLLHYSCQYGWLNIVRHLIATKTQCLNCLDSQGKTPLHYACQNHHTNLAAEFIITGKVSPVDFIQIALPDMSDDEIIVVFQLCLSHSVDILDGSDSLLHLTCAAEMPSTVEFLLTKARLNPDLKNKDGNAPIELTTNPGIIRSLAKRAVSFSSETVLKWLNNNNCIQLIEVLLNSIDPNKKTTDGETLLHLACCDRFNSDGSIKVRVINKLLSHGYDPNIENASGMTALELTVNLHIMKILIERKAEVTSSVAVTLISTKSISEEVSIQLFSLAKGMNTWNPAFKTATNDTALHLAVKAGRYQIVKFLVEKGDCDVNTVNGVGKRPIQLSSSCGCCKYLVGNGAVLTADVVFKMINKSKVRVCELLKFAHKYMCSWNPSDKDFDGNTALHLACKVSNADIVEYLLSEEKCDPNIANNKQELPIQLTENLKVIEYLIHVGVANSSRVLLKWMENKSQLNMEQVHLLMLENPMWKTEDGNTVLHYLCKSSMNNRNEIVQCLLSNKKCDPNSKNSDNKTALDLATDPEIMRLLISEGKVMISTDFVFKLISTEEVDEDASINLLKLSMENSCWNSEDTTADGDTALHLACKSEKPNLVHFLLKEKKSDPNSKNTAGKTPIQMTMNPEIIKCIVKNGGSASSKTILRWLDNQQLEYDEILPAVVHNNIHIEGKTLINCDVAFKLITNIILAEELIIEIFKLARGDHDWNAMDATCDGNTALHLACKANRTKIVQFLLFKKQCDPNTANDAGITSIQMTTNPAVLKYLADSGASASSTTLIKLFNSEQQLDIDIFHALLRNNADWKKTDGNIVLHYLCDDSNHACCNKVELVQYLLSLGCCDPNSRDDNGNSAFNLTSDPFLLKTLIQYKGIVDNEVALKIVTSRAIPEDMAVTLLRMAIDNYSLHANANGDTVLHCACGANKATIVKLLLDRNICNPNSINSAVETPIQLSLNPTIVKYLIKHGATISSKTLSSWLCNEFQLTGEAKIALLEAVFQGSYKKLTSECDSILSLVYRSDCFDEIKAIFFLLANFKKYIPNFKLWSFISCEKVLKSLMVRIIGEMSISKGILTILSSKELTDSVAIKLLLLYQENNCWRPDLSLDKEGNTALHCACKTDNISIAKFLLYQAQCNPNKANRQGKIAFVYALSSEMIRMLIDKGTLISTPTVCSWLSIASSYLCDFQDIFFLLNTLLSDNPNRTTTDGDTFLHIVCGSSCNCPSLVEAKITQLLHFTCNNVCKRTKIIEFLLSKLSCNPNVQNKNGLTPLQVTFDPKLMCILIHFCATVTADTIYKLIIEKFIPESMVVRALEKVSTGWNCNDRLTACGDTALHIACKYNRFLIVDFLLDHPDCNLDVENADCKTPLAYVTTLSIANTYTKRYIEQATSVSSQTIYKWFREMSTKPFTDSFLSNFCWCYSHWRTSDGDSILHLICNNTSNGLPIDVCHDILLDFLYGNDLPLNVTNNRGETPLQLTSDESIIRILVNHGSDMTSDVVAKLISGQHITEAAVINILNQYMRKRGYTRLIISEQCTFRHLDLVDYGNDALCLACEANRSDIAIFLLQRNLCNPNAVNKCGESPLQLAMSSRVITSLISHGAFMTTDVIFKLIKDQSIQDLQVIKILKMSHKEYDWDLGKSVDSEGNSFLHLACKGDRTDIVLFLLSCPWINCDLNAENHFGDTPIQLTKKSELLSTLFHHNIRPGPNDVCILVTTKDIPDNDVIVMLQRAIRAGSWRPNDGLNDNQDTSLHFAMKSNRCVIVDFLLSHTECDPSTKNLHGEVAFVYASTPEIVKVYSRHVELSSEVTCNWLQRQSLCEKVKITELIIALTDDSKHWKTTDGDSLLHLVCNSCSGLQHDVHRAVIIHLLMHTNDSKCTNKDGKTPLQITSDVLIMKLLLQHGVEITSDFISRVISSSDVTEQSALEILELIYAKPTHDSDENEKNGHNKSTTKDAPCKDEETDKKDNKLLDTKNALCKNKETDKEEDDSNDLKKDKPSCGKSSFTSKFDLSRCLNDEGDTALHLACRHNRSLIVYFLLLEVHSNPNVRNNNGLTALQLTTNPEIICSLFYHNAIIACEDIPKLIPLKQIPEDTLIKMVEKCSNWDCNRIITEDGDTALHLACKSERVLLACTLLSEEKCDPNIKNKQGETPLRLTLNSEIICTLIYNRANASEIRVEQMIMNEDIQDKDIIKVLTILQENSGFNIDCSIGDNGDTILHLACKTERPTLVEFLIIQCNCNMSAKNKENNIPLVYTANQDIVKWHTVRHLDLSSKTVCYWLSKQSECHDIHQLVKLVKGLLEGDPNWKTIDGDTILHLLCDNRSCGISIANCRILVDYIVDEARCDTKFNIKNKAKFTPVQLTSDAYIMRKLSKELSLDEIYRIIKVCKDEDQINELLKGYVSQLSFFKHQKDGNTILQLACSANKPKVVFYLLSEGHCNPNIKNKRGKLAIDLTKSLKPPGKEKVVSDLVRHGSQVDSNFLKLHGQLLGKSAVRSSVTIFVVGDPSAGKSTLVTALKMEIPWLKEFLSYFTKDVTNVTQTEVDGSKVGIIPHDFEHKQCGQITVYDFTGQKEFHDSHAALLQHAVQSSSPIFIIVVNLKDDFDQIKTKVHYWASFLENEHRRDCTPHLKVVGSHLDCVDSKECKRKVQGIDTILKHKQQIKYLGCIPMDCRCATGKIRKFREELLRSCNNIRKDFESDGNKISFTAQCLHRCLNEEFRATKVAVTITDLLEWIKCQQRVVENDNVAYYLPNTPCALCNACNELSNTGLILLLRSQKDDESWIITNSSVLLSKISRSPFGPLYYELSQTSLESSTGVVPLSKIKAEFHMYDSKMLTGFLTRLELCWEVSDHIFLKENPDSNQDYCTEHEFQDVTEIIGGFPVAQEAQVSLQQNDSSLCPQFKEVYYFFPGLIPQSAPENIWDDDQEKFKYHCGWMLQCNQDEHFFSSQFLRNLLLQLVFSFTEPIKVSTRNIPAIERKCLLWKNGLFWGNTHGVETLIEMFKDNKAVVIMIRYQKEPDHLIESLRLRSEVIKVVLECEKRFCLRFKCTEYFVSDTESDLGMKKYPIEIKGDSMFRVEDVMKEAISPSHRDPSLLSPTGTTTPLQNLTMVINEPYTGLRKGVIHKLHKKTYSESKVSNEFLKNFVWSPKLPLILFAKLFEVQVVRQGSEMMKHKLYEKLCNWRDTHQATYKSLREKIDEISIFANSDTNLLVSTI